MAARRATPTVARYCRVLTYLFYYTRCCRFGDARRARALCDKRAAVSYTRFPAPRGCCLVLCTCAFFTALTWFCLPACLPYTCCLHYIHGLLFPAAAPADRLLLVLTPLRIPARCNCRSPAAACRTRLLPACHFLRRAPCLYLPPSSHCGSQFIHRHHSPPASQLPANLLVTRPPTAATLKAWVGRFNLGLQLDGDA